MHKQILHLTINSKIYSFIIQPTTKMSLHKNGINPDFLAIAIEQAEKQKSNDKGMDNWFF